MTDMIDALQHIPLFANLTAEQLRWVAEQGQEIRLHPGDRIASEGDPADGFYIILAGETEWTKRVGQQEVHAVTLGAGTVFAELILILDAPYPTTGRALTSVRLYKLTPETFWQMLTVCPSVLRGVVAIAAERSQIHESVSQQHAKLISLGTMAAGLAHELNNPAASVQHASGRLRETFTTIPKLVCRLNKEHLTAAQSEFVDHFHRELAAHAHAAVSLSPLERSEREDELADWFDSHDIAHGWEHAATFVQAQVTTSQLDTLAEHVPTTALGSVIDWIAATLSTGTLLDEMVQSSRRISTLVKVIKDYAYLDQAPLQEIDIREGIENTLIILGHRLQRGTITIHQQYEPLLPRICAYGNELNQVWTNLIDNALDAIGDAGELTIRTASEAGRVLVEIRDNGPGIPPAIQERIWEPFFTTKDVGSGTGLGLDTCRRIVVNRHGGEIRCESQPGDTRFQVRLPLRPSH